MSGYPPPSQQVYPPQYPGYPQAPQQAAQTTVVFAQPVVAQPTIFRDRPVVVTDSNGQQVQTVLEYRNGTLMWVAFLIACLFVGIFAFVVFFFNDFKDVYHITPTDGKVVGVYKRLG